jgi:glycosyltransferase involved in cell wall biosynthesis
VQTIIQAARLIREEERIRIDLVGDGQDAEWTERQLTSQPLSHVRLSRKWMTEERLVREHLARTDVCLGIFSSGPKAMDVVPAKVHLALASDRPTLTADSPAVREELLRDPGHPPVLVCPPASAQGLADALRHLRDTPALRAELATAGRAAYEKWFTPARIVDDLVARLSP